MLKNVKALSPVIAAVILVGVTLAVSVAVGAWLSTLTFQNMKTEELKIVAHRWAANNANVTLTVKAAGTAAQTIAKVSINGHMANMTPSAITLQPGDLADIVVSGYAFQSGVRYEIQLLTATGYNFAYPLTVP